MKPTPRGPAALPSAVSVARRFVTATAIAAAAVLLAAPASAQAPFPSQTARVVVPFTPGGNTDLLGRVIAQGLTQRWGTSVIVENKPGAAGTIGVEQVVRAQPDGYTMVLGTFGNILTAKSLYPKLNFSPVDDLVPIALIATPPVVLVANADAPFGDVKSLIAYAKQNPGKLAYGSSGAGSSNHLIGEYFATLAGIRLLHVPYKGSGPSVTDTVAGVIQLNFAPLPLIKEHLRAGRLKALGVSSAERTPVLPDVPTVAEAGLPGFDAVGWFGLLAPKATPVAVVNRINRDVNEILKSPDVVQLLGNEGAVPVGGTVEAARRSMVDGEAKWRALIGKMDLGL